jgi:hypothetical protein
LLALQPHLIETPAAIDAYIERQIGYALAMVEGEKKRRAESVKQPSIIKVK